jgi:hypothetical protein
MDKYIYGLSNKKVRYSKTKYGGKKKRKKKKGKRSYYGGTSHVEVKSFDIDTKCAFLDNQAFILSNLKPNKKGLVELKDIPLLKYNTLHIVANN